MAEIIICRYDFIEHQNHITELSGILRWLGLRGFELVHYSRPQSRNELYQNVEFVAQRSTQFNKYEREAWRKIQASPFSALHEFEMEMDAIERMYDEADGMVHG